MLHEGLPKNHWDVGVSQEAVSRLGLGWRHYHNFSEQVCKSRGSVSREDAASSPITHTTRIQEAT